MFVKMKSAATAVAAAGLMAMAGAAAADAATVTGGGTFAANAGASRLVVTGGAAPLNCTTTGGSGSVANGTYTPPSAIGTIVPTFSACTGPLGLSFTVNCSNPSTALNISANPVGGVTAGSISGIRCVVTFTLTGCDAVIEGSVPATYSNPGVANANGRIQVQVAGQSLAVTSTECASIIPVASASFGAPGSGSTGLANLNYNLTSTGPTVS